MIYFYYVLLGVFSYFLGNISSARIVSKFEHGDVTKQGSGNPGTLNVWRAFGFWAGVLTFVLDALKGVIATLVGYFLFPHIGGNAEIALFVAGFFVILGHIFPVCYRFKGGKGIATAIGVFLVANWWVSLIAFVVMIVGMLIIKYASIFTIGFVIALSIIEICLTNPTNWVNYIFIAGILLLILFAHRSNIKRLLTGKENKTELIKMLKHLKDKKKDKTTQTETEQTLTTQTEASQNADNKVENQTNSNTTAANTTNLQDKKDM